MNQQKSGIAVLVGRSNAGKSTLLNALIGFKASIVSPLPQTTRHAIQGVLTTDQGQVVFVDTPGLFTKSRDILTKKLNQEVHTSTHNIHIIVYVVDPTRAIGAEEQKLSTLVRSSQAKKILVINKTDTTTPYLADYEYLAEDIVFDAVIKISALKGTHLATLTKTIFTLLPEGEILYPPETHHNLDTNSWLAELIREKVYFHLKKELPYSVHVVVEEVAERSKNLLYIKANLITTQKKYRGMIIGSNARIIKEISAAARKELEILLATKIYLELEVVVDSRWQEYF